MPLNKEDWCIVGIAMLATVLVLLLWDLVYDFATFEFGEF